MNFVYIYNLKLILCSYIYEIKLPLLVNSDSTYYGIPHLVADIVNLSLMPLLSIHDVLTYVLPN